MLARLLFPAFCGLLLSGPLAQAQDLLTRRNGDELQVKVLEITPTEVRYRRTDNPDGPLISVWKADVFKIRYANGTSEIITPLPGTQAAPAAPPAPAARPNPNASIFAPAPASPPTAPTAPEEPVLAPAIQLSGPRVGFTLLTGGVVDRAKQEIHDLNPFLTQFGWQFETQLFRMPNGVSGLVEFVPLVGGLEQGKFIPSISGLLGIRGPKGFEFGVGPNVTPIGTNIVLALGTSFRSNGINFPVNLAVVPGNNGARISLLMGFNARRH